MDILVKFSEIHKKKGKTRDNLVKALRQRIQDKLEFEGLQFDTVSHSPDRIIIYGAPREAAEKISFLPGVKYCLTGEIIQSDLEEIKQNLPEINGSFGVRVNTRSVDYSSQELEKNFGGIIQEKTGEEVDLERPDCWVRIEFSDDFAHISTDRFEGPGGFPAATLGHYLTLVSGGIDSPVAAYEMMKRGADITPLYFFNRPVAAEDHLIRFEKCIERLKEFNPSKNWEYILIDMEEANQKLMEIESGRMVLHRKIMFEAADRIREKRDLDGIVTGESLSQKSSQTPQNLKTTSAKLPIYRPLLTLNKNEMSQKSRNLGLFEYSKIDSACRSISPENPSTNLSEEELEELKEEVGFNEIVDELVDSAELREID
jgi:thiamine biosynthesis protein ThiI